MKPFSFFLAASLGCFTLNLPILANASESQFGCTGLELNHELPAAEGRDGVFFRVNADLRMNHPFSDIVVDTLAELSRALEARGTTLIFVPIPTKSVSMPSYLPDSASLYGFDLTVATRVHTDILERLEAKGVHTVDIRQWLLKAEEGKKAFFNSDFHWSAYGADLGAQGIAEVIRAQPKYEDLEKTQYVTEETGEDIAFSGMRRVLQKRCQDTLPQPTTMTYHTAAAALDLGLGSGEQGEAAVIDLFGSDSAGPPIALVGTSFSDSPINNFPGFIAQHSDLEVVNYAITGGNQFGAISSYLTSEEFQEAPPAFLIWENPIYNNLAQYGDQPLRELIAAAANQCDFPLAAEVSEDRKILSVDLAGLHLGARDTIFLDIDGSAALEVDYTFYSYDDVRRVKLIRRGERLRRTGRFYMPFSGLWPEGASRLDITVSAPVGRSPQVSICNDKSQEQGS